MFTFEKRESRVATIKVQVNVTFQVYNTASCFHTKALGSDVAFIV